MLFGITTEKQNKRLEEAFTLHKYGNLETWQELVIYQAKHIGSHTHQVIAIGEWAKKFNNGENIKLPLKLNR